MKVKVSESTLTQLNWMVAKCEGMFRSDIIFKYDNKYWGEGQIPDGIVTCPESVFDINIADLKYSTDWGQGGPIIERELIRVIAPTVKGVDWVARVKQTLLSSMNNWYEQRGPTPLIAAMRCYVANKLGDEVEIPEELI